MKRRIALKNLAAALGGMVSLPAWADGWSPESLSRTLSVTEDALLAEVAETIIPATDIPGAKSLGVHTYIQKMVKDCMEPKAQTTLQNGLKLVGDTAQKQYNKGFASLDTTQKLAVLNQMGQSTEPAAKDFYTLAKSLTVRGFTTSEYYLTNIAHYRLVPGFYHGCVPVSSTSGN